MTGLPASRSATLLILLPRSTRARIIAADFGGATHHLLNRLAVSGSRHAGLFQLAALAALEGFFQLIYGSGNVARRLVAVTIASRRSRRLPRNHRTRWRSSFRSLQNLHQVEIAHRL